MPEHTPGPWPVVEHDVDTLLARLTPGRAGYLDNLSGGAVALAAFQHVRLSPDHPTVHLAYSTITEENKMDDRGTYCGHALRRDSLLGLHERVSCELCLRALRARRNMKGER